MELNIGVDLGGTNLVIGLVEGESNILAKKQTATNAGRPAESIVEDIDRLSREAAAEAGVDFADIRSIGFGSTGIANSTTGRMEFAANLFWSDVPIRDLISGLTGKPVFIDNDANAAAYGEHLAGAGKDADISMTLTIGTGIGTGLVIRNEIYRGFNFAGMEAGHMVIIQDGRPCKCGRKGCYERYASASGLIYTTGEFMDEDPASSLWTACEGEKIRLNGRLIFDAADAGDATALRAVDTFIGHLACGVTSLLNMFQPEILAVGGGISAQGERILAPVREIVSRELYSRFGKNHAKIVKAELGNDAGIIGTANLWKEGIK
ncbi:MAG: ROK family protein [Clostridiales Family XIII bacterium]|jgi:glucokinase|nr:ROK family protein [Clostridiales Family XIII bacterium]